jgi:phosphonate transport system ATP-binding protein
MTDNEDSKGNLLEIRDLRKHYGATKAVDGVSFNLKNKEILTIIGRSGAGKSTIMRCINRLVPNDGGSITLDGVEITNGMKKKDLLRARCKIGFIFQHFNLVSRLTVFQNVMHGKLGHVSTVDGILGKYNEDDKEKAFAILKSIGIEDQLYKRAGDLSGGQKQRVAIARALMQEPSLLLCDEPIASLDPVTSRTIMDLIVDQASQRGIACLFNLHQVDFAKEYSTRILGMRAGRLVFDGVPKRLTDDRIEAIYGAGREADAAYSGEGALAFGY